MRLLRAPYLPAAVLLLQQPAKFSLDSVLRVLVQLTPELQELDDELVVPGYFDRFGFPRAHDVVPSNDEARPGLLGRTSWRLRAAPYAPACCEISAWVAYFNWEYCG